MKYELRLWLADKLLAWVHRLDPGRFRMTDEGPTVTLFDLAAPRRTEKP